MTSHRYQTLLELFEEDPSVAVITHPGSVSEPTRTLMCRIWEEGDVTRFEPFARKLSADSQTGIDAVRVGKSHDNLRSEVFDNGGSEMYPMEWSMGNKHTSVELNTHVSLQSKKGANVPESQETFWLSAKSEDPLYPKVYFDSYRVGQETYFVPHGIGESYPLYSHKVLDQALSSQDFEKIETAVRRSVGCKTTDRTPDWSLTSIGPVPPGSVIGPVSWNFSIGEPKSGISVRHAWRGFKKSSKGESSSSTGQNPAAS